MTLLLKNKWEIQHEKDALETSATLLEAVLSARGYDRPEEKEMFLSPPLCMTHDPFLFRDMDRACDAIIAAIRSGRKIVVYGDYDVDGITSTAMLVLFLKDQGAQVGYLIPDRILEGYGLTEFGVRKILDLEAQLVVTVDCGIASVREVQDLIDKNIGIVITDHHECKTVLPDATAVVNPKRPDSVYPFRELAGAGVVLKLIQALGIRLGTEKSWMDYTDLAAIGTIADVVPLCGENRMIAYHGLVELNRSKIIGLNRLLDAVDRNGKAITSTTIGYGIAPRINAAGRMGDSNRAVRLLITKDPQEADLLANDLINDNKKRQEIETEIFETAKEQIRSGMDLSSNEIIVVYRKGWHQGVIGIVASRLVELFNRSVIIFGGEDGFYKGSARSAKNESILEAIEYAGDFVHQFGGHKKAAGLVVRDERMEDFRKAIKEYSRKNLPAGMDENTIRIDFEIPFEQITLANACDIARMAPFGEGNPLPVFVSRNLTIGQVRYLSSGRHMKLNLTRSPDASTAYRNPDPGGTDPMIDAIAFGFSEKDSVFSSGERIDAAFSLESNEWNGCKSVQIFIKDIQKISDAQKELVDRLEDLYRKNPDQVMAVIRGTAIPATELIPQKPDFIAVYQYLKTNFQKETVVCDLELLSANIASNYQISLSVFKLARIFDIFMDVDILRFSTLGRYRVKFQLMDVLTKVSLSNSRTYQNLCIESVIL